MERTCNRIEIFDIALFLLLFITGIVATTAIFLLVGIPVSTMNILFPLVSVTLYIYYKQQSVKRTATILLISLSIFIICVLLSGAVFDTTWDGAAYHKQAVGLLKEGWNPIYQSSADFNRLSQSVRYPADNPLLWAEVYPKATWYFAASIYYITDNIETGKAYTLLFMFIAFAMFFDYFKQHKSFKSWQALLIAILVACNPISLSQLQSYYLDGLVAYVLLGLILLCVALYDNSWNRYKSELYAIVFCLIIFGCNTKFSVVLFTGTSCIIFFISVLWRKEQKWHKLKRFSFFVLSTVFAFMVVGASPYFTNLHRYGSPFHGFNGLFSHDFILREFGIDGLNNAQRFFVSLFAKFSHGEFSTLDQALKIPFTFSRDELFYYNLVDPRVGGFGVFFSGVLVISLPMFVYYLVKAIKAGHRGFIFFTCLMTINIIEMMFLPGTYQVRYIPQLYLIPIAALAACFYTVNKIDMLHKYRLTNRIAAVLISVFMTLNVIPYAKVILTRINNSVHTQAALTGLKESSKEKKAIIAFYMYDFTGMHYNLKDYEVSYDFITYEQVDETFARTYSDWIYYKLPE